MFLGLSLTTKPYHLCLKDSEFIMFTEFIISLWIKIVFAHVASSTWSLPISPDQFLLIQILLAFSKPFLLKKAIIISLSLSLSIIKTKYNDCYSHTANNILLTIMKVWVNQMDEFSSLQREHNWKQVIFGIFDEWFGIYWR